MEDKYILVCDLKSKYCLNSLYANEKLSRFLLVRSYPSKDLKFASICLPDIKSLFGVTWNVVSDRLFKKINDKIS